MNPEIHHKQTREFGTMTFTLSHINVSLANALRRTILSDIPLVVFRTTPIEESKCVVIENTTRMNNEIIKQRLSCIPIHIKPFTMPTSSLLMELNIENKTDAIMYATTEHFKIKNMETGSYLSEEDTRSIFPKNEQTQYFIDFVRLRPTLTDTIPGEKLHLTCEFSIATASENSMFNAVSLCSYGNTPNPVAIKDGLERKQAEWKAAEVDPDAYELKSRDWMTLDSHKLFIPDSFDFSIQTACVHRNEDLVKAACTILGQKLKNLLHALDANELPIEPSRTTMENCVDVILEGEDYTIGKALEYVLHTKLATAGKSSNLIYCGFCKYHPHDTHSVIRLAYKTPQPPEAISENLKEVIVETVEVFEKIKAAF